MSAKKLLEEIRRRMVRVENTRAGSTPQRRVPTWKVCSHGAHVNSLHRCCTAANSRRSFATAANMSEEFILSIKFIVLIMVTHNSTLLGTLPPFPTNDSLLFESEHPLIPPRCFSASTLEANGWPIQSNGCSIQSFNFVPRSPPCVCCFSSPP